MISFLIIPFLGNGEDLEPFSSPVLLCVTSGPGKRNTEVRFASGMVISASSLPAREWG